MVFFVFTKMIQQEITCNGAFTQILEKNSYDTSQKKEDITSSNQYEPVNTKRIVELMQNCIREEKRRHLQQTGVLEDQLKYLKNEVEHKDEAIRTLICCLEKKSESLKKNENLTKETDPKSIDLGIIKKELSKNDGKKDVRKTEWQQPPFHHRELRNKQYH